LYPHPNLDLETIESNLDKQWDWQHLTRLPIITIDFIKKYPQYDWNWTHLSLYGKPDLDIINQNLDKRWDWGYLSSNRFLYTDAVKLMEQDAKNRRQELRPIIERYITGDITNEVLKYISWD
jgi:hypothetical protein